jgi:hypothetical protein
MAHARSAIALEAFGRLHARTPPGCAARVDPRLFGRGRMRILDRREEQSWSIPDDVRLFATTFAAGFLFVSILIA